MTDEEPLLVDSSLRDVNEVGTDADADGSDDHHPHAHPAAHDSIYESLDYDTVENAIWEDEQLRLTRREQAKRVVVKWFVTLVIGVITGILAFAMGAGIQYVIVGKLAAMQALRGACGLCWWGPLLAYAGINVAAVLAAASLATFVEPAAGGSGIPEIKCYLNGVKVPHVVRIQTLVIKVVGTVLSVGGGMSVGKEGPMIHTGAIVAAGISQGKATSLSWSWDGGALKSFRNDREKRDFVSAGAAAGVGAAFGAPIGGVMFSLEEGSSFWNQEVTLRTFFCSVIATFTLNFWFSGALGGNWGSFINPGLHFGSPGKLTWTVAHFPLFLGVACIGGVLGALFNMLNGKLTLWRVRWGKWPRWAEALIICIVVSFLIFGVSVWQGNCVPLQAGGGGGGGQDRTGVQLLCAPGEINDIATFFMSAQDEVIRYLFNTDDDVNRVSLFVFFLVYLATMIICYGAAFPGALFVPALLAGSAWGRLIGSLLAQALPTLHIEPGAFALIGAASLLGGITRMTLALTVILIESTANTSYGLPLIMSLLTAKWVGDLFNEGALESAIEAKRIPLLGWDAPFTFRKFRARHVMQAKPVCLPSVVCVVRIVEMLSSNSHNGFPVINARGQFVGLVLRSQIISLIKAQAFQIGDQIGANNRYRHLPLDAFLADYPRYPSIQEVLASIPSVDDPDLFINLEPYLNPSPFVMRDESSLARVFRLFRTMGLRHLVIVNIHNEVVGIITRKDLIHLNSTMWVMDIVTLRVTCPQREETREVRASLNSAVGQLEASLGRLFECSGGLHYAGPEGEWWMEGRRPLDHYFPLLQPGATLEWRDRGRQAEVVLLDGTRTRVRVDDARPVADVMAVVGTRLGLPSWAVWEYGVRLASKQSGGLTATGREGPRVGWLEGSISLAEQGAGGAANARLELLWLRRWRVSDHCLFAADEAVVHYAFLDCRATFLEGDLDASGPRGGGAERLAQAAAALLHVEHGRFDKRKHTAAWLEGKRFLPPRVADAVGFALVGPAWRALEETSAPAAKRAFVELCQQMGGFGASYFPSTTAGGEEGCALAIDHEGLALLAPERRDARRLSRAALALSPRGTSSATLGRSSQRRVGQQQQGEEEEGGPPPPVSSPLRTSSASTLKRTFTLGRKKSSSPNLLAATSSSSSFASQPQGGGTLSKGRFRALGLRKRGAGYEDPLPGGAEEAKEGREEDVAREEAAAEAALESGRRTVGRWALEDVRGWAASGGTLCVDLRQQPPLVLACPRALEATSLLAGYVDARLTRAEAPSVACAAHHSSLRAGLGHRPPSSEEEEEAPAADPLRAAAEAAEAALCALSIAGLPLPPALLGAAQGLVRQPSVAALRRMGQAAREGLPLLLLRSGDGLGTAEGWLWRAAREALTRVLELSPRPPMPRRRSVPSASPVPACVLAPVAPALPSWAPPPEPQLRAWAEGWRTAMVSLGEALKGLRAQLKGAAVVDGGWAGVLEGLAVRVQELSRPFLACGMLSASTNIIRTFQLMCAHVVRLPSRPPSERARAAAAAVREVDALVTVLNFHSPTAAVRARGAVAGDIGAGGGWQRRGDLSHKGAALKQVLHGGKAEAGKFLSRRHAAPATPVPPPTTVPSSRAPTPPAAAPGRVSSGRLATRRKSGDWTGDDEEEGEGEQLDE